MENGDHSSKTTHDHGVIRKWVEERGGRPAVVKTTESGGSGLLRIDFAEGDETLDEISWEEFFRIFEENNLDFLYQEKVAEGGESRFFKFIEREQ